MRDKIGKILSLQGCEGYDAIGEILALLAPELEKARFWDEHVKSLPEIANNIKQLRADAEKWRKVRKIFFDCSPCTGCTGCDIGSSESCKMVMRVNRFIGSNGVDALEGEEEG